MTGSRRLGYRMGVLLRQEDSSASSVASLSTGIDCRKMTRALTSHPRSQAARLDLTRCAKVTNSASTSLYGGCMLSLPKSCMERTMLNKIGQLARTLAVQGRRSNFYEGRHRLQKIELVRYAMRSSQMIISLGCLVANTSIARTAFQTTY